jgi:hypothetical protein
MNAVWRATAAFKLTVEHAFNFHQQILTNKDVYRTENEPEPLQGAMDNFLGALATFTAQATGANSGRPQPTPATICKIKLQNLANLRFEEKAIRPTTTHHKSTTISPSKTPQNLRAFSPTPHQKKRP